MKISNAIEIKSRFSSSINLERDTVEDSLDGYIPTGRALDVIRRIANGISDPSLGRSISITGPHGGGKSSLAVFIDSLVSEKNSKEFKSAFSLLKEFDSKLAAEWSEALKTLSKNQQGFFKAVATANREPVLYSLARALKRSVEGLKSSDYPIAKKISSIDIEKELDANLIINLVKELSSIKPVIFMIDEFGKNLEAYADSPAKADPYILQALAELGQGHNALPIFIITLQHLSFDEYVQATTVAQRREWAKIQGRFQDIPFIESAMQSRRLVASVFIQHNKSIKIGYKKWIDKNKAILSESGLNEIAQSPDTLNTYPLSPLALSVLPTLCSRYGQNERTLFSFLASKEKSSVASFMSENDFNSANELKFVGLDQVYDYFLESASTILSTSSTASRWLEIETRIRDAQGLNAEEFKILKSIGILNLISSGGTLRATKNILKLELADLTSSDSSLSKKLEKILDKLEKNGFVVYRAFADEFRIWQGSDFDLRTAVELARKSIVHKPLHELLNEVADLGPVVAARASQDKGILRVFSQVFSDPNIERNYSENLENHLDGLVIYSTTEDFEINELDLQNFGKPTIVLMPKNLDLLKDITHEVTALHKVLNQTFDKPLDWVARKELVERYVVVKQKLQEEISKTWLSSSKWISVVPKNIKLDHLKGLSAALSTVTDSIYFKTPKISNEMISKRELSGQGAKARRNLLEAIRTSHDKEFFGIQGFGPDRAIYQALFKSTGMHLFSKKDGWVINRPTNSAWAEVWDILNSQIDSATKNKISIEKIHEEVTKPPFGLKDGILPILTFAIIIKRKNELAIYEHGSLILDFDDAVLERFTKNPANFSIRNYAYKSISRASFLNEIIKEFGITNIISDDTFIEIIKALYRELHLLNPYTKNVKNELSEKAQEVRQAFFTAAEPDKLLFETIPQIFGKKPIFPETKITSNAANEIAIDLVSCFRELKNAYPKLLDSVRELIAESTSTTSDLKGMRKQLIAQAVNLENRVLDKTLQSFVSAIKRDELSDSEWLENIAMVTLDGNPARGWSDEDIHLFSLKIHELGGALKRLQALLFDRLSKNETPFESIRITMTHPNGAEFVDVVSITEQEKEQISKYMIQSMNNMEKVFGSYSATKSALLAWLTTNEVIADSSSDSDRKVNENG